MNFNNLQTRKEARKLYFEIKDEVDSRWDCLDCEHEFLNVCKECEETYSSWLEAAGLFELEEYMKNLPLNKEVENATNLEEW